MVVNLESVRAGAGLRNGRLCSAWWAVQVAGGRTMRWTAAALGHETAQGVGQIGSDGPNLHGQEACVWTEGQLGLEAGGAGRRATHGRMGAGMGWGSGGWDGRPGARRREEGRTRVLTDGGRTTTGSPAGVWRRRRRRWHSSDDFAKLICTSSVAHVDASRGGVGAPAGFQLRRSDLVDAGRGRNEELEGEQHRQAAAAVGERRRQGMASGGESRRRTERDERDLNGRPTFGFGEKKSKKDGRSGERKKPAGGKSADDRTAAAAPPPSAYACEAATDVYL
ncbi:LOW QUALITY PROTEIN: hypothetical protein SETIT_9G332200v2 [Setaria italica]|uniref:Uncharacterized protein n=1 Tax=Setaria italica TaxID=4555 RepID=A0A368SND4_SETIT|nr:LOW QUALITY PROTEIN: hypothetical protein SETIT_9G332200v2 [Setaria italica]